MTSKNAYLAELATLHYASVGVIITRTKEEARCLLSLEDFAHQHSIAFRFWNCRDGWVQEQAGRRICDGTVDPFSALGMVQDTENAGAAPLPPGIYAMMDTDFVVADHPALLRSIKEAARTYCDTGHRLILIVPPTFSIPETLTHHVSILDFELPTREEILESYERTVKSVSETDIPAYSKEEKEVIVNSAIGMTSLEAENIMARAIVKNAGTWPDTPVPDFCRVVMEAKTEIIKRSEVLELHYSLDPASLGGLDLFKAWLQKSRKAFTPEAKQFGVRPPKGTMLVGVPGTGKSIAVRCVAHILGMPLIRLDVSRVFGSLVGETEGKVRAALMMLDAMAPCVTGDTKILMADGSERTVDDLRGAIQPEGDLQGLQIATVDESGERVESRVHGWIPRGSKTVLEIVDESDNLIRVTDEHKFLIRNPDGSLEWREAKHLREGDDIVRHEECGSCISPDA